ncbi:DUF4260 family protein [Lysinibacillus sp. NPDC097287]|uniref:DUF4260 family protein n=1 Tax=Lysinibacillus sp. NPDC097287 TaxID=3364144 RepID=UPI00381C39AF
MSLRKVIYLEYFVALLLCFYVYLHFQFSLLVFFLLLFIPDISMLGYLFNSKIGALLYNIVHSLVLPLFLMFVGFTFTSSLLLMTSLIWLAHILLDRALGFGLKYKESFKQTHLQKIA